MRKRAPTSTTASRLARRVMEWIQENVANSELDFATMWKALPDDGKADMPAFDEWMLTVTKGMSPQGFDQLQEKIKAHLRATKGIDGGSAAASAKLSA